MIERRNRISKIFKRKSGKSIPQMSDEVKENFLTKSMRLKVKTKKKVKK